MAARDPETRRLIASLGGHARSAQTTDRRSLTAAATEASSHRWERQARELHPNATEVEIARVAQSLLREHMTRMVLARHKAARLRREAEALEAVAAEAVVV